MSKILFAVTNHYNDDNGLESGCYILEVAVPYFHFLKNGLEVDFVSPKGGKVPVKQFDLDHPGVKRFFNDKEANTKIQNSFRPQELDFKDYDAIYYPGGYGVMYDIPHDTAMANLARDIYENGGFVCAVCHGVAGLLNIQLSSGKKLIEGKTLTAFSNKEEIALGADVKVPYLLEDALIEAKANYVSKAIWQCHVIVDGRLITGQNTMSDLELSKELINELNKTKNK